MTPIKLTVDTGYRPQYERYGYLREITASHVIMTTAAGEKYATCSVPLASVVDLADTTADLVEANAR